MLQSSNSGVYQGKSSDVFGSSSTLDDLEQRLRLNRRTRFHQNTSAQTTLEKLERRVGITKMISDTKIESH